ncbi:MAG: MBL fold metallo-hydrolase [Flavobacteriales bacterium]|nr:MBL fold metallo-hydrolase [Flavobacteriales bacterium]MCB9447892.1 MBL fold metallo-hydrolase [Flavobacteriales bacterium]
MKITFLGTGTSSGVPMIACECDVCKSEDSRDKRLRTSVMVETGGQTLVIDSGPDFRQQMLASRVMKLDALLFTHEHKDHVAGMDDVRAFNFRAKKPLDVYATQHVFKCLEREFHYVFHDDGYPGVPKVNVNLIEPGTPFDISGLEVMPFRVWHHKLPVTAFRIGDFSYVTDANAMDDEAKDVIRRSRVMVINALRKEKHISHFTLDEAIQLAKELEVEQTFLTHISHQLGKHAEVSVELPSNVALAFDGLEVTLT